MSHVCELGSVLLKLAGWMGSRRESRASVCNVVSAVKPFVGFSWNYMLGVVQALFVKIGAVTVTLYCWVRTNLCASSRRFVADVFESLCRSSFSALDGLNFVKIFIGRARLLLWEFMKSHLRSCLLVYTDNATCFQSYRRTVFLDDFSRFSSMTPDIASF